MKKNIGKNQDEQEKKIIESFIEENYQEDIWQRCYMDRIIEDLIRNIRDNQKETGDIGREYNRREKEHWKQFRRRKRKNKE